eukprot:TRINITY_DN4247_c0_g1_i34.p1 TRINITY_DN4247_c0_g1~~TRINITY_DN4247_c0_g1_i34.p1  ORF type:complete len:148 (-),score=19.89 TRINITY_DN4247_c0_g1_i34:513-956(-)
MAKRLEEVASLNNVRFNFVFAIRLRCGLDGLEWTPHDQLNDQGKIQVGPNKLLIMMMLGATRVVDVRDLQKLMLAACTKEEARKKEYLLELEVTRAVMEHGSILKFHGRSRESVEFRIPKQPNHPGESICLIFLQCMQKVKHRNRKI